MVLTYIAAAWALSHVPAHPFPESLQRRNVGGYVQTYNRTVMPVWSPIDKLSESGSFIVGSKEAVRQSTLAQDGLAACPKVVKTLANLKPPATLPTSRKRSPCTRDRSLRCTRATVST